MLFILLPVHNRLHDTQGFIDCCIKQRQKDFALVVIDDGSEDGTYETIAGIYPWIHVIKGDGNLWWTGAINLGLDHVLDIGNKEDYVMTINNDVRFDDSFFEKVMDTCRRYKNSIFNPISISFLDKKSVHFTGTRVISWFFAIKKHPYYGASVEKAQKARIIDVDYLNGRGTTIPLSAFLKIGTYNQKEFPHYGADEEFTLRAKRNGYRVFINPQIVVHVDWSTTGQNPLDVKLDLREILRSFTAINSTNNLKSLYRFSRCCAPRYAFPSYFLVSFLKVLIYNFILNYIRPGLRN